MHMYIYLKIILFAVVSYMGETLSVQFSLDADENAEKMRVTCER